MAIPINIQDHTREYRYVYRGVSMILTQYDELPQLKLPGTVFIRTDSCDAPDGLLEELYSYLALYIGGYADLTPVEFLDKILGDPSWLVKPT